MPYEQQWDPNVMGPCPTYVEVKSFHKGEVPSIEMIPCPVCGGRGEKKVGGYVRVWVDPGPPINGKG